MIRAVPANAFDSIYCSVLAQMAVHAALATWRSFELAMLTEEGYSFKKSVFFGDIYVYTYIITHIYIYIYIHIQYVLFGMGDTEV